MIDINEYINNDFKAVDIESDVDIIQNFFADNHFTHFPVTDQGVYIGSVGSDDAETFDSEKNLSDYRYTLEGFFARKDTIWLDVLEVFARNRTNVVPVLDENNTYSGYYEIHDVVKAFNDTPFLKEQGGIIVVEKGISEYSMGQVVQIVESNNAKILGLFVSDSTADTVQITIKTAMGGLNEIIQTFRRYNYEIISEHQEDSYLNGLKDRSDYLDKYLNI
ncbi:MAG TPA: CBS domain-containing protein [Flavobacterium sp.]|jgi:CBS domain containing-hemolysin-like protein|nr:CBS domain-containing protein [Flavobacterium sp.]